jgi:hypothetical protein
MAAPGAGRDVGVMEIRAIVGRICSVQISTTMRCGRTDANEVPAMRCQLWLWRKRGQLLVSGAARAGTVGTAENLGGRLLLPSLPETTH